MSALVVRPVAPSDYAQWLPLWDGYNAFYGRSRETALAGEITAATWARFHDAAEPVLRFEVCTVAGEEVPMNSDLIRGETFRFTFSDGPMANKTFEHVFDSNGTVTFHMVGASASSSAGNKGDASKGASPPKYESATIRGEVAAVSYLGAGGYTLTTLLDFATKKLVAFSSNDKGVSVQHGTFERVEGEQKRAAGAEVHHSA